jgi:hypothetical protein
MGNPYANEAAKQNITALEAGGNIAVQIAQNIAAAAG